MPLVGVTRLRRFAVGILTLFSDGKTSIAQKMAKLNRNTRLVFDYLRMTKYSTNEQAPALFPYAIKKIHALAEAGNATAQFHMGKLYASGNGVEKDIELAEVWYLKAVACGELRAHCNLGIK